MSPHSFRATAHQVVSPGVSVSIHPPRAPCHRHRALPQGMGTSQRSCSTRVVSITFRTTAIVGSSGRCRHRFAGRSECPCVFPPPTIHSQWKSGERPDEVPAGIRPRYPAAEESGAIRFRESDRAKISDRCMIGP